MKIKKWFVLFFIMLGMADFTILAGCDVIISWNFKHIVNVKTVKGVKIITTMEGYKDLLIYPPSALLEGDDEIDGN